ncbi:hypothetical protein PPERSA_08943 [Pseudocohnilembus persalinus]|uniref:Uncharacterized protein n=1 Tax=Pseudocohnilembus persalinus TaxID=266149 RepID=A0A0V0R2W0_PSEPJ|nr:hypothetical protein PPERSA_08943 [Pseudocohnilembus persalinus]|eukprot:KRX08839.1 hypothetical protein PPERSA_08943 [Pseudocohnilembus persalinus]
MVRLFMGNLLLNLGALELLLITISNNEGITYNYVLSMFSYISSTSLPQFACNGMTIFCLPVRAEEIAFFPQLKETWLGNFIPSYYIIIVRQAASTYLYWLIQQAFQQNATYDDFFTKQQQTPRFAVFQTDKK